MMNRAIGVLAMLLFADTAQAQLCFDVFLGQSATDVPTIQCADADYFFDSPAPGFDPESFTGSDTADLAIDFDGIGIFPVGQVPSSLTPPFSSGVEVVETANPSGDTIAIDVTQVGNVTMGRRDSEFQSAAFQTRSRVSFIATHAVDPFAAIDLHADIDFDFQLSDPVSGATNGSALAGFGLKLEVGDPDQAPEFDISALTELDSSQTGSEVDFFGFDDPDLDDAIVDMVVPPSPDFDAPVDIDVGIDLTLDDELDLNSGDRVTLEFDSFGSVFSDGFESGDTSSWSASSPNSLHLSISSPDPDVTFFLLVPEPSSVGMLVVGMLVVFPAARRSRRRTSL